ncbi:hypothetical protein PY093_02350 [Cytobacillus sp. S13-E01]|uniref:hypothetical protein n=1 Tax=Cytobacillus sp. S13-E01 TaxID=3031326 RepID=UPI0023D856B7|nr:hypothetical protein [Cytobacillus sp. S13-E01]MDF0725553.1 hypothetical protein [Cytobacillus sp. S13-E01]
MKYYPIKEVENLYHIENVLENSRLLWYKLAEGFEIIPTTYLDFVGLISRNEKNVLHEWKLTVKNDGSLSLIRGIKNGSIFIEIDRNGKETYKILPIC